MADKQNSGEEKKFTRIPEDFLKGIKLIPRNFDMPEKPLHGEIVNRQLREDLFETAYAKICNIEFQNLKEDDDYFKIKNIKKYSCSDTGFFESLFDKYAKTDEVKFSINPFFNFLFCLE